MRRYPTATTILRPTVLTLTIFSTLSMLTLEPCLPLSPLARLTILTGLFSLMIWRTLLATLTSLSPATALALRAVERQSSAPSSLTSTMAIHFSALEQLTAGRRLEAHLQPHQWLRYRPVEFVHRLVRLARSS